MRIGNYLLVLAPLALVNCVGEPTTVTTTTTTREVTTTGPGARGLSDADSACGSRRDPAGLARTGICLDSRLLALDRDPLCVGIRELGLAAAASRSVGAGPLGAPSGRLGVDRRPLAVNPPSTASS
jgi:hypothetical protein